MRAAVYLRLSKDRDDSTAIARQKKDCLAFAKLRGWTVAETYADVDLSGYRKGVTRPEYERMLADVTAGTVDLVLVWKLDRLIRRVREWERVWLTCEQVGANVATVHDGIDTTSPTGKAIARIIVTFAELESETMSFRIRSDLHQRALDGGRHGGGRRAFGLNEAWTAVVPEEAALIAEAAARVLNGDSLRSIVLDWEQRGIRASRGGAWKPQSLRTLLLAPRIAGLREHHGKVVADGAWPALLDLDKWGQVRAVLTDPARTAPRNGNTALLSGLVRCTCGTPMKRGKTSKGEPRYQCPPTPEGCGGRAMKADPLDTFVVDAAIAVAPRFNPRSVDAPTADELAAAEQKLLEIARDYDDGVVGRAEWLDRRERAQGKADQLRARALRAANLRTVPADLHVKWLGYGHAERRAALAAMIDRVTIWPSGPRRGQFDDTRIVIDWRS